MKFSRIVALSVVVLAGLVTIIGSGGGGGGVGAPPANPAPQVTSMTPASNSDNVALDTTVTATFNEAMDANTIDSSTFTLQTASGNGIPAAVTYDANTRTATLTPNNPLNLLTAHTAELSTVITDQDGARLSNRVDWDFLTVDRQWGNPVPVSMNTTGFASSPKIAVNLNGDALAVWSQWDLGGVRSIYANSYTNNVGWGLFPVLLEQDDTGNAGSPHVAINENGAGFAVWNQRVVDPMKGAQTNVYANRYTPGTGFSGWEFTATKIGFDPTDANGTASLAQVAVDSAGNAVAAWEQEGPDMAATGIVTSIWANAFDAGLGDWGSQELLENDDNGNASGVRIASSTDAAVISQAVAVWDQVVGPALTLGVWSNRFTQGVGWRGEAQVDTSADGARRPALAMNADGDALAVWEQDPAGNQAIWAARFVPGAIGSGWETPRLISGFSNENREDPQVAINGRGDGLALYNNNTFTALSSVSYRDDNWDPPMSVSANARNARIAIDLDSNGVAVWERDTGARTSIVANRWFGDNLPITGATDILSWGTEQVIDGDGGVGSFSPDIGVDLAFPGRALVIWEQAEAVSNSIWGNRLE